MILLRLLLLSFRGRLRQLIFNRGNRGNRGNRANRTNKTNKTNRGDVLPYFVKNKKLGLKRFGPSFFRNFAEK